MAWAPFGCSYMEYSVPSNFSAFETVILTYNHVLLALKAYLQCSIQESNSQLCTAEMDSGEAPNASAISSDE